MKNLLTILCLFCFIASSQSLFAQDYASVLDNVSYKKRSPIYDYSELQLSNTDTIPDFDTKSEKLKITGTIYQSDGKTPASDVILYVFQPDENGNYELKRDDLHKRYIYHRGWVKTNADGQYTIYTFMPGKYIRSKELKQIHRVIKEPGKPEYELASFFFNDDPLIPDLTLACRAKAVESMLRLEKEGAMFVATKDIILEKSNSTIE
jgi:protocatechuate 3,4-dioxygenase, beta subunit